VAPASRMSIYTNAMLRYHAVKLCVVEAAVRAFPTRRVKDGVWAHTIADLLWLVPLAWIAPAVSVSRVVVGRFAFLLRLTCASHRIHRC
jgi:hypothetical protein